jgi:hypothetical protein
MYVGVENEKTDLASFLCNVFTHPSTDRVKCVPHIIGHQPKLVAFMELMGLNFHFAGTIG